MKFNLQKFTQIGSLIPWVYIYNFFTWIFTGHFWAKTMCEVISVSILCLFQVICLVIFAVLVFKEIKKLK